MEQVNVSELLADAVEAVNKNARRREVRYGATGSSVDFDVSPPISAQSIPEIESELKRRVVGHGDPAAVKVIAVAGVYPDGDSSQEMLSRVTAVAFSDREALKAYLADREARNRRDHRTLGVALGLYVTDDTVGKGLPLLKEKGATIRRVLERYIVDEEVRRGYRHVNTPALGRKELYEISGHLAHYSDTMFPPMEVNNDELVLRPMTCPHHFMLYKSELRSYRDLPIRYAEISPLFRKELSGGLYGLVRILQFHLADAHIFCTQEQIRPEFLGAIDLIRKVMDDLGLTHRVSYRLSLRDASKDKFIPDDEGWEFAESTLRSIVEEAGIEYQESPGDAAHYGPKLDIEIENSQGKQETLFTNQLDFALQKRFDLQYVDRDGSRKTPFVIHRSSIGCVERTIALLTEEYEGAFPFWLAPVQVAVLPVADDASDYARGIVTRLADRTIRVELDDSDESIGKRLHAAKRNLIPYVCIVGRREAESHTVTLKSRDTGNQQTVPLAELADALVIEASSRAKQATLCRGGALG